MSEKSLMRILKGLFVVTSVMQIAFSGAINLWRTEVILTYNRCCKRWKTNHPSNMAMVKDTHAEADTFRYRCQDRSFASRHHLVDISVIATVPRSITLNSS